MENVRFCAQTMDEMFRALLDLSRLDASTMRANIRPLEIAVLLDQIKREFRPQAEAKDLTLHVASCSAVVLTAPALLERILRNLVSNALRYTDRGKILVGCRRTKHGVRLAFYDTGSGIAADQQDVVFEEFYQVGNPERDRRQGLGLGLAIVQRLANLLNAPLALKSEIGRGSTFSIDLSCALKADAGSIRKTSFDAPTDAVITDSNTGRLIVFVDDETIIVDAMRLLLENWGYRAVLASSGDDAIEQLSSLSDVPDAIMCDYRLRNGETGIEVIAALRSEFNSDIPVILITGDSAPEKSWKFAKAESPFYISRYKTMN